ncbi:MAG: macro domain-containing protein, partial [Myxococcota bacterium]
MRVRVVLVDVNGAMISAWRQTFEENPEVEIVHGSMLDQPVSAFVTPTNARGSMDGGLDGVLKNYFGAGIEKRVQAEIAKHHQGAMPVGNATCVSTGQSQPR